MEAAKSGDKVRVNYTGKSEDGQVFESSVGLKPFIFTIGSGEVIKGFEDAVIGMQPGEYKKITVEPEDGYGLYDEDLVIEVPKSGLPSDLDIQVGMDFEMEDEDGNIVPAVVIEIMSDAILVDANAPLAGKRVIYEIELIDILRGNRLPGDGTMLVS
ncbi:MAG TPA: peptidylprolyl isomerase [Desulfomonilia bacterium]|nr:peptidylprolyl isomerase [Desulfomonilia bacterium]